MHWLMVFFTYWIVWWLLWFMALPIGVKAPDAPGLGHDPGAPEKPYFKVKIITVSLLAALATWGIAAWWLANIATFRHASGWTG